MAESEEKSSVVVRLQDVEIFETKNDVIFCGSLKLKPDMNVIFFGGDVQDYSENMLSHRENKDFEMWNLESTARILSERFPSSFVWIVKPTRMELKTFSVYDNFVKSSKMGDPYHSSGQQSWHHLQKLIANSFMKLKSSDVAQDYCIQGLRFFQLPATIIGFSKGCVVLNQLLYDLEENFYDQEPVRNFIENVDTMIWLDGGHNGGNNTWITQDRELNALTETQIEVEVHVTPYQMKDIHRPWIGQEQEIFVKKLEDFGVRVTSTLHFETKERSLENHFSILKEF